MDKTGFQFICDDVTLEIISQYKYLGLMLTEHLDYLQMTKFVAKSASRALGFLICKDKALGGIPFKCFTKCYNSLVQPVIDYCSSIWGTNGYSCVEVVQNRACRYFLGLGKYAPTPARSQSNSSCRTWCYRVKQFLISIDHEHIFRAGDLNARLVLPIIDANLKIFYEKCWQEKLQAEFAVRGEAHGGNKLRTYRTFKKTYIAEPYVHIITQKKFRSAYAKFRCGVAPINIELCRYGLASIPVVERVCSHCNEVEDELHVLMHCPLYDDIRNQLTLSVNNINPSY